MEKIKLIVNEEFNGKQSLEDALISAFQTKSSMLMSNEKTVIMKSTKQYRDSFCSGKGLENGTNE